MLRAILILSFFTGGAFAGGKPMPGLAAAQGQKSAHSGPSVKYARCNVDYFTCDIPASWEVKREKEKEAKTRIYKITLLAPVSDKGPVAIYAAYYSKGSKVFAVYKDFIERNSKNILGETESPTEKFGPVKETILAGLKAFEFESEIKEYIHPENKSEESVQLKEKIYVLPAKEGFYALRFSAPKAAFTENLPVFERIAKSFKGKP